MVSRMRVTLMIVQRIPANVIAKRNVKRYQRGSPPAAVPVVKTSRAPRPVAVIVDPAAIVIRSPTPRFVAHPGPAIRGNPAPATVAIRRPVVVVIDYGLMRPPDPAVVVHVGPVA